MLLSRMVICCGVEKNPPIPRSKDRKAAKFQEHIALLLSIKACARERDLDKGTRIYTEIVKGGLLKKNISVGNTLIHMYAKCGSLVKAQHVFDELPVRNVISWTALIAGYAKYGLGKVSVKCFEEMQYEGLLPNEVTFVCTLKACGSIGAVEKGNEIHSEIVKEGILGESSDLLGTALVDMYAKCGAIEDARKVFENLHDPSLVLWTALISGYAENGHGDEALKCYEHMQHKGLVPDAVTFSCLLKACGSIGASEKAKEIHAEILRGGLLGKDIILGNALMDMYGKFHAVLKAQEVFDQHHLRDAVTWNILISGYCQQAHETEALSCFARMQCEAFPPDVVTFSCILKACGSLCVTQKGKEIHSMIEIGVLQTNSMVGSALVEMYAKCGELVKAQQVFDGLPARDVVSWNALISEFCEQGHGEKALNYFKKMQDEGVSPDAVTLLCTLKASSSIGAGERGKEIHSEIVRGGFLVEDTTLGTALVDMYAKCGLIQRAKEVFDQIQVRNVVTWNALITGYAQLGEHSRVHDIFKEMIREGIEPTLVTFMVVLTACSSSGLVTDGQMYFEFMTTRYGIFPNPEHYTCMINLFGCSGHFDKLVELIKQMPPTDHLPAWLALLSACQKWGNVELARLAFENAVQLDEKFAWPYVCMDNICRTAGKLEDLKKIKALRVGNQCTQGTEQLMNCQQFLAL